MAKVILTKRQSAFLDFLSKNKEIINKFYFSGGTCLSEYYLHHRFSEDLDFFTENEFDPISITILFKQNKQQLNFESMEFQQSFNRNLYFFKFSDKTDLKLEFTFYPFSRIERITDKNGMQIDSLKDICVNKLFTIYQNPRGRDFYDLYAILQEKKWQLNEIIKLARVKFDTPIDLIQLGGNFMKVENLKDDPLVLEQKYNYEDVVKFFNNLAYSLKDKVLSTQ